MVKKEEKKDKKKKESKKKLNDVHVPTNGTNGEAEPTEEVEIQNGTSTNVKFPGETEEERKRRRKLERRKRSASKRIFSGKLPLTSFYSAKAFGQNWEEDTAFITRVFQYIPESKQPYLLATQQEQLQEYLLDEDDEETEKVKKAKFMTRTLGVVGQTEVTRAANHDELKERFKKRMEELAQKRNEKKLQRKLKKRAMSKDEDGNSDIKAKKAKQFISQSNPNVGNANQPDKSGRKPAVESLNSVRSQILEKTPLKRKRPVVKSDGQVVYSKFDFISDDKRGQTTNSRDKRGKAKPTDLLKTAEKYESKITRLEAQGKKEDAVSVAESRKWDTALKRAEGEKIRDDPFLLKKTIKKQDQLKQASRKKWQERMEHVDHQKKQRQDKRSSNIQARKDDNKKRSLKLQRKKGRIL